MTGAIQTLVRATDALIARGYLSLFRERSALLSFLFHSLFRDQSEIAENRIDPLERTTVDQVRELIVYYLDHGYRFIGPDQLLRGLEPGGKYAMITFDDGYFNNRLVLPILEEYKVPALFFIATNNVREHKCFWWDVLYRERHKEGRSRREIYREALALKYLPTESIERELMVRFGKSALDPQSDIDRPFTPAELAEFASSPFVHLGNHTANHAILTNYTPQQCREQLAEAQEWLGQLTGKAPTAIAYPNGAHDPAIRHICQDLGLTLGFTTRPQKNPLPLDSKATDLLQLGRFVPHNDSSLESQCRTYRSDLLVYASFRSVYLRLRRGRVSY